MKTKYINNAIVFLLFLMFNTHLYSQNNEFEINKAPLFNSTDWGHISIPSDNTSWPPSALKAFGDPNDPNTGTEPELGLQDEAPVGDVCLLYFVLLAIAYRVYEYLLRSK